MTTTPQLGTLTMRSGHSKFTVACDALAVTPNNYHGIMAMSVAGADTSIKAIRAVLHEKQLDASFAAEDVGEAASSYTTLRRFTEYKYEVAVTRLGLNTVHMVAVAEAPGLLRSISEESLWRELRSERYTTPLLRHWMPWIRQQLDEKSLMQAARCFGCNVGQIAVNQEELDDLISQGVGSGELTLTERSCRHEDRRDRRGVGGAVE